MAQSFAVAIVLATLSCVVDASSTDLPEIVIAADEIRVRGTSELIANVRDLVVMRDTVWVLNVSEPLFIAFDAEARFVRAWGERGGGPEEFGDATALVEHYAAQTVWAYDATRHVLRRLSGSLDEPRSLRMPYPSPYHLVSMDFASTGPGRPSIALRPDGILLAIAEPTVRGTMRLWRSAIVLAQRGTTVDTIVDIAAYMNSVPAGGTDAAFMVPHPLWAICPDHSIVLYDPARNVLHRMNDRGTSVAAIKLPPKRQHRLTIERLASLMYQREADLVPSEARLDSAQLYDALTMELESLGDQVSDVFPEYTDLQCSEHDDVWLQPFDPNSRDMGRGPLWMRFHAAGIVHSVRFPQRFAPFHFVGDGVWGVLRDDLDVPSVAWVSVPKD